MKKNRNVFNKLSLIFTSFLFIFGLLFAVTDKRDSFKIRFMGQGQGWKIDFFSGASSPFAIQQHLSTIKYTEYFDPNDFFEILNTKSHDTYFLKPKNALDFDSTEFGHYYHINDKRIVNKEIPYIYEEFIDDIPDYCGSLDLDTNLQEKPEEGVDSSHYVVKAYFYTYLTRENRKEYLIEYFSDPNFPDSNMQFKIYCYLKDTFGFKTLFGMIYINAINSPDIEYVKKYLSEQVCFVESQEEA